MKSDYDKPAADSPVRQMQANGQCGESIAWNFLDTENKLTISGRGRMVEYPAMDAVPWASFRPYIRRVCIDEGITDLCDYAFADCQNLASVQLGKDISAIGKLAFYNCNSLFSIHIPATIKNIGISAFSMCNNLEHIDVDKQNVNYASENGVLFNKARTILVCYPEGKKETTYVVPDSVKQIGFEAFINCRLQSVILPDEIEEIGDCAFLYCRHLERINIPQSIKIGRSAFFFCGRLHHEALRHNRLK